MQCPGTVTAGGWRVLQAHRLLSDSQPVGEACAICVPVFHHQLGKAWGSWRLPVELCQIPEGRSLGLLVSLVLQYTRPGWRVFMGSRSTGITEFLQPRGPASNGFRCEGWPCQLPETTTTTTKISLGTSVRAYLDQDNEILSCQVRESGTEWRETASWGQAQSLCLSPEQLVSSHLKFLLPGLPDYYGLYPGTVNQNKLFFMCLFRCFCHSSRTNTYKPTKDRVCCSVR